jgi:hypothetical protein
VFSWLAASCISYYERPIVSLYRLLCSCKLWLRSGLKVQSFICSIFNRSSLSLNLCSFCSCLFSVINSKGIGFYPAPKCFRLYPKTSASLSVCSSCFLLYSSLSSKCRSKPFISTSWVGKWKASLTCGWKVQSLISLYSCYRRAYAILACFSFN